MFQPCSVCSAVPSQDCSSRLSTYHSPMDCLTLRFRIAVARLTSSNGAVGSPAGHVTRRIASSCTRLATSQPERSVGRVLRCWTNVQQLTEDLTHDHSCS